MTQSYITARTGGWQTLARFIADAEALAILFPDPGASFLVGGQIIVRDPTATSIPGAPGWRIVEAGEATNPVQTFPSRSHFVAALGDGYTAEPGRLVLAAGRVFAAVPGATDIADLPGWAPAGDLTADQFPSLANAMAYAGAHGDLVQVDAGEVVRIPTDAPDLQTALDRIVTRGDRPWTLLIEDGHRLTGGLTLRGDWSHVTISSEAAEVGLAPAFPSTTGLLNIAYGTAPVWDILIDIGGQSISGDFGALNYRECAQGLILPGKGARGGGNGTGLFLFGGANVYADRAIFRQFPAGNSVWVTHKSEAYLERAELSDSGFGMFVSRGSSAYIVGAKLLRNNVGMRIWRSLVVAFPHGAGPTEIAGNGDHGVGLGVANWGRIIAHDRSGHAVQISGFTHGVDASSGAYVDVRGGSIHDIVYDGVRATDGGTLVNVDRALFAAIGRNPIMARQDGQVLVNAGQMPGAVATALLAQDAGRIIARNAILSGCQNNLGAAYAMRAGYIDVSGADVRAAVGSALYADAGSKIVARSTLASGSGVVGARAEAGSEIDVSGADLTGATSHGMRARDGSRIIATVAQARRGASDDPADIVVDRGATIVAHGATGGVSIAPNTVTYAGIIYKEAALPPALSALTISGGTTVGSTVTISWTEGGGTISTRSVTVLDDIGSPVTLSGTANNRTFTRASSGAYTVSVSATGPGGASNVLTGALAQLAATAPDPFTAADIALAPITGGYSATVSSLPDDGGSPITRIDRQSSFDGGTTWGAVMTHDTEAPFTGTIPITDATAGPRLVRFRAVNAVDPGSWGPGEAVTIAAIAPSGIAVATSPEALTAGDGGEIRVTASGTLPRTYTLEIAGATYTAETGVFPLPDLEAGDYAYTVTVTNSAGSDDAEGEITIAPAEALILSVTHSPLPISEGQPFWVDAVTNISAALDMSVTLDGVPTAEWEFTPSESGGGRYMFEGASAGEYAITITATLGAQSQSQTVTIPVAEAALEWADNFDDAAEGSFLSDRPGWDLAFGTASRQPINSGGVSVTAGSNNPTVSLSPDMDTPMQMLYGVLTRQTSMTIVSCGWVLCYEDEFNFLIFGVQGADVRLYEVSSNGAGGWTYTAVTLSASVTISGVTGATRYLGIETDGRHVRVFRDSLTTLVATATLSRAYTGTRAGIMCRGGTAHVNQIRSYTAKRSPYYYMVAVTAPQLTGLAQVGYPLIYTPGTFTSSAHAVTAHLERWTGTAWEEVQVMAPGASYVQVTSDVGRYFRIREVPAVGADNISANSDVVIAAAPLVANTSETDRRQISVDATSHLGYDVTPASWVLQYRLVGASTWTEQVAASSPIAITLPSDGAWEMRTVPVTAGAVRGTPSPLTYYWVKTVGEVTFHGLNAQALQVSWGSPQAPVELVPISGRKVHLREPIPKYSEVSFSETLADGTASGPFIVKTNGVSINPSAFNGKGPGCFDNRLSNMDVTKKTADGKWSLKTAADPYPHRAALVTTQWPQVMGVDDTCAKAASTPLADLDRTSLKWHSFGLIKQYAGLVVVPALSNPLTPQMAPSVFKYTGRLGGSVGLPGFDDMMEQFAEMTLATAGLTIPDTAAYKARIQRFDPSKLLWRGGTHDNDAPERFIPKGMVPIPTTQLNYYEYQLYNELIFLLTSDAVDSTWKHDVLAALVLLGHYTDRDGAYIRTGAGVAQWHEQIVPLTRIARGVPFEDLPETQPGNWLTMYHVWTPETLAYLEPHNDFYLPSFSRRRQVVTNFGVQASGRERVQFTWYSAQANVGYGDELKQRYRTMKIVRESNGEERTITYDPNEAAHKNDIPFILEFSPFSTPLATGEWVYFKMPDGVEFQPGDPEWNYGASVGDGILTGRIWNAYNPMADMSYRDLNEPQGMIWGLTALGRYPDEPGSRWAAVRDYTVKTWETAWPGTGEWDFKPTGAGFRRAMWQRHAATMGLT